MLGTLDKVTETIYVLLMIKSIQRLATAVKGWPHVGLGFTAVSVGNGPFW